MMMFQTEQTQDCSDAGAESDLQSGSSELFTCSDAVVSSDDPKASVRSKYSNYILY